MFVCLTCQGNEHLQQIIKAGSSAIEFIKKEIIPKAPLCVCLPVPELVGVHSEFEVSVSKTSGILQFQIYCKVMQIVFRVVVPLRLFYSSNTALHLICNCSCLDVAPLPR